MRDAPHSFTMSSIQRPFILTETSGPREGWLAADDSHETGGLSGLSGLMEARMESWRKHGGSDTTH